MKRIIPLVGTAAMSLAMITSCQSKTEEIKNPNILFIIADDLGYHDLSCLGSRYYETPNIDRIAAEGMNFTHGYANCQVCSPSRASIMSGKFTARHDVTNYIGAPSGEDWRRAGRFTRLLPPDYTKNLPHEYITLPEALKEAGYKTFYAGKWHLGSEGSYPEDHGFDINQGGFEQGGPYTGGFFSPFNNPKMTDYPHEVGMSLPMKLAKETEKFIREHRDTTFFAFLSFYAVHAPIQTTREKWARYRQKAEDMGIAEKGFKMGRYLPERQVQDNPVYAGLVEMMDDAVGHILLVLDELGLDKNTIVIFTSDNGGVSAGDAYATSNKPLRGGKGTQFEGGIREPYFIKIPWMNIAGKKTEVPAIGSDFYPTLLELAGAELKPDEHIDGISLVPVLMGGTLPERPLIFHFPHYGNQGGEPSSMIRLGEWKLIHYYEDGRKELYNLLADESETINLANENPNVVKRLSDQLFSYLHQVGARFPERDPEYDPEPERLYLERIVNQSMPRLEERRLQFLSVDFDPGNNWWGSDVNNQ